MHTFKAVDFNPFEETKVHSFMEGNTLLGYFEKQVTEYPNRVALSFYSAKMSYRELNEKANQLANYLVAQGTNSGDTVGIIMNRSTEMIVSLLAILKSGATFVPIDPQFPNDRILYMLEDSEVRVVLTNAVFAGQFSSKGNELIIEEVWTKLQDYRSEAPTIHVDGNSLAYILYTSGSTGKPKGVQIKHHNLLNFLLSMQKQPGILAEDKVMASTTISFDISILEIFLPLITGAQMVLIDEEISRSAKRMLDTIRKEKVTIMQGGPALFKIMLYEDWKEKLPLKVLCGGEALPKDLALKLLSRCREVWNMYGPTETTIWSTIKKLSADEEIITIGSPIDNTQVYILDESLAPLPVGQEGEIYIAGDGLALGYLNRAELTEEKFIPNPFSNDPSARIYGTGDMGILLPNGEFQCLGRLDHQIKINGVRIELGEIEQKLIKTEGVKEAIVIVREDENEAKNLYAYIIPNQFVEKGTEKSFKIIWRETLKKQLPLPMIPQDFILISAYPLTPNGKIDRKALPKPDAKRPELTTLYTAPDTKIEQELASIWIPILHIDRVGVDDNFFDIGGNSLLAVKAISTIKERLGYDVLITTLYQFPTIKAIAELIEADAEKERLRKERKENKRVARENSLLHPGKEKAADIAVIGMTGRFPMADNVDELWTLLKEGKEGISFFSKEELDPSIPEDERNDPDYVPARGIISGVEDFDAAFFGINPRLAELMDPQQRVFLEICWEALEESGYTEQDDARNIGVFAGCSNGSYFLNNVQHHRRLIQNMGEFQVKVINEKDYLSSRVSYALNLKGPAVTVQSACSTSLLAIAQAVESLRNGSCDMALAGGVSIFSPIKSGHIYQEGSMQSADGHCRPFDGEASGTIFSDGAGVVLLKPLEAARQDGDTIYAVIKGVGMNNDGAGKGSFTAPSSDGQSKAIIMALEDANFDPRTISYVEAHGTATPLGDPIEFEGLKQAFDIEDERQFCAIGSVKSNIGHLNTAAGVIGFIKTCLSMHHQQIPPTINYTTPNPYINFEESPFYVTTSLEDWILDDYSDTRRAGVSSFGVGGTNVHIVLEEAEHVIRSPLTEKSQYLINWSAKSEASRALYREKLLSYLEKNPTLPLADLAFSLQGTRSDFNFRQFMIASSREALMEQLGANSLNAQMQTLSETIQEIAFVFPGQGSQYLNMGKELYHSEPIFKAAVDECVIHLQEFMGEDILKIIFSEEGSEQAVEKLNNTYYTQPALFVIEYAVAKLMISWGVHPSVFVGHSIGEFVAAHLSGIFTLKDALFLISTRGKLMADLPPGRMLAIRSRHEAIQSLLPESLSMAAVNSPGLCVVAGTIDHVEEFTVRLEEGLIASTHLHTSHAFHSSMMDEIVDPFEKIIRSLSLSKPSIPIVSTVTGTWMTDAEAQDPHYWASHLRNTVNFLEASKTLLTDKKRMIIECGPRNVLSTLLKQQGIKDVLACPTLHIKNGESENLSITQALGQLWLNGIKIDWKAYYAGQCAPKIKLPSYAFAKKRYWVEPLASSFQKESNPASLIS